MEVLGARLGRSTTRYGPAAVFNGPVRKWKKTWVPLSSNAPPSNNNASHLLLYNWTPAPNNNGNSVKDDATAPAEEPPRRKFRYVPVSVIEEQTKVASEQVDDKTKPIDISARDTSPVTSKHDDTDGKPGVNFIPVEDTQASDKDQAELLLNETNLDLSLGLKAHDGDHSTDKSQGHHLESKSSGGEIEMKPVPSSEPENRNKRKSMAPNLEMRA